MMARFQYIDPNTSEYQRRGSPTLMYGGMTYLRVGIAFDAATSLARAAVVAVRYTATRQQFKDDDDPNAKTESAVLNYKMVQFRLLPVIAASYALHFAGRDLQALFGRYETALATDQAAAEAMLAELHLKSCALKSYSTSVSIEGIETCRRSMGGHGYSQYSGLGHVYAEQLPSATYEGDNFVLTKQVARSLIKTAGKVRQGKAGKGPIENMFRFYVSRKDSPPAFDVLNNDADLVAAFAWVVSHQTFEILRMRTQDKETWNNLLVPFWRLSTSFSQWVVVSAFHSRVHGARTQLVSDVGAPAADALTNLFRLNALTTLDAAMGQFAASGAIDARAFATARHKALGGLIDTLRPHALRLAEGWGFSDFVLASSLGRADGSAYEDLFRKAATNPVNGLTFDVRVDSDVLIKRTDRIAKL